MASPHALPPPPPPNRTLVPAAAPAAAAVAAYTTLEEAMTAVLPPGSAKTNGPASSQHHVDVYGLLVHCSEPRKTRGSDWCVQARIVDGTWGAQPSENDPLQQNQNNIKDDGRNPRFPVSVMFFAASPLALPRPRRGGGAGCVAAGCDIIRVHRAQVCDFIYNKQPGRNLVAKVGPSQGHPASFLLFDGGRAEGEFGEDAEMPYQSSSRGFAWEPEAEPRMLEALRSLSAFLAVQAREAEAAFHAAAAAAAATAAAGGEEEGAGGEAALAAAPPPLPLLVGGPPPSAVRHLGRVLRGDTGGSFDLGPVRVEAVEREKESSSMVIWVFDGSDAPPLGRNGNATATLSRLSDVLAADADADAAAVGGEGETVVNGGGGDDDKASGPGADAVVVPAAGPARELEANSLPQPILSAVLGGTGSGLVGRRRTPPSSLLPSLPSVGTVLPVVLALPPGAPAPPLPAVGDWVTFHKLAAASVGGLGGGQAIGVFLESSHWARAAVASGSSPRAPFRADPEARDKEGDTASWAPRDRSFLVAVPLAEARAAAKETKEKKVKGKKRGRGGDPELSPLPERATLRSLTQRARVAGALAETRGAAADAADDAAVRARVLCRVLKAEPRSSSSSSFDVDLVLEDATGIVVTALRGRQAEVFFNGAAAGAAASPRTGGGASGLTLAERCARLVAGEAGAGEPSEAFRPWPWAELVVETTVAAGGGRGAAAAASKGKRRRGGGGGGNGGEAGGDAAVAFAVVDSVSRWPLPSSSSSLSSSLPASPAPGSAVASPLSATQAVPPPRRSVPVAVGWGGAPLAATQAPPQFLAPTQAVPDREQHQQLEQTQAVPLPQTRSPAGGGLAETFVLSPLRRAAAAVRAALPGGGGGGTTGQGRDL